MVELHGWALLRENFTADCEDENLERIIAALNYEIAELGIDESLLRISYSNGASVLTVTRFTNHFSDDLRGIIDLFRWLAKEAPGSYGLVYLYDDENKTGFNNDFQVFVLSRGTLRLQKDPFLSPYIPTVEDEEVF